MTNYLAKITRAACLGCFVMFLPTASFAIGPDTPSGADAKPGECLSGPKGSAPQGERWYYRVERGTKRKCWYTRAESPRNVAARTPAAEPAEPPEEAPAAPLQPSVANARAEAAPSVFPPPSSFAPPPAPDTATPAASTDGQGRTLADRWSDHPNAGEPAQSLPATATAPTMEASAAPSGKKGQGTSLWMVLSAIGGTLALIGLAYVAITQFARRPAPERSADHWPSMRSDVVASEPSPSLADDEQGTQWDGPPINWVRIAREKAENRENEIEQLLARSTRTG